MSNDREPDLVCVGVATCYGGLIGAASALSLFGIISISPSSLLALLTMVACGAWFTWAIRG